MFDSLNLLPGQMGHEWVILRILLEALKLTYKVTQLGKLAANLCNRWLILTTVNFTCIPLNEKLHKCAHLVGANIMVSHSFF